MESFCSAIVHESRAAVLNLWSADHWWSAAMCLVVREQGLNIFWLYRKHMHGNGEIFKMSVIWNTRKQRGRSI